MITTLWIVLAVLLAFSGLGVWKFWLGDGMAGFFGSVGVPELLVFVTIVTMARGAWWIVFRK
jgi:hypothetical protein